MQQLLQDKEPQTGIDFLHADVTNFLEARSLLIDMASFIAAKTRMPKVRNAAKFSLHGYVINVWHNTIMQS